jgi:hypothetical protein
VRVLQFKVLEPETLQAVGRLEWHRIVCALKDYERREPSPSSKSSTDATRPVL